MKLKMKSMHKMTNNFDGKEYPLPDSERREFCPNELWESIWVKEMIFITKLI